MADFVEELTGFLCFISFSTGLTAYLVQSKKSLQSLYSSCCGLLELLTVLLQALVEEKATRSTCGGTFKVL